MKFFDPLAHFDYLERRVLPSLLQKQSINVWSAACSNGAEAYSLSLLLAKHPHANILGSDRSRSKLEIAIKGDYSQEDLVGVPDTLLQYSFRKGVGNLSGQYRVHDFLRRSVQFYTHNLTNPFMVPLKFDVIFCQNALKGASEAEKERIENNISRVLVKGGFLFIGLQEQLFHLKSKEVSPSVYQF